MSERFLTAVQVGRRLDRSASFVLKYRKALKPHLVLETLSIRNKPMFLFAESAIPILQKLSDERPVGKGKGAKATTAATVPSEIVADSVFGDLIEELQALRVEMAVLRGRIAYLIRAVENSQGALSEGGGENVIEGAVVSGRELLR